MKLHTLPNESITIASSHRDAFRDGRSYKYRCSEDFYFDFEGKRNIIRLEYCTNMAGKIEKKLSFNVKISHLCDYDTTHNRYDTHLGTKTVEIDHKDASKTLELYRSLRAEHLNETDRGFFYKR